MMDLPLSGGGVLDESGPSRVLRTFQVREGETGVEDATAARVGAILDVETTGLTLGKDRIIELAIRRFRFDARGQITEVGRCYSWLEDPGEPLADDIVELTGLTNQELTGQQLDDRAILNVLFSADVIIAHNACFDRPFVEHRIPDAAGRPWACSHREIDWQARGLKARSLGCLLCKQGWDHVGHRAKVDVDGVLMLLGHRSGTGQTALEELVANAEMPGWRVWAHGANIDVKDLLKTRGYSWDAVRRVWFCDIKDEQRVQEERWLENTIYSPAARPKAFGPTFDMIDWCRRWSS